MLNVTGWATFYLRIWRIGYPGFLDVSDGAGGPNLACRPFKVYEEWYQAAQKNETWREQDVTAWGRNWTFVWNRVEAPIHADSDYYVQWTITGGDTTGLGGQCGLFSPCDIGEDGRYWTFWHDAGGADEVDADLDLAVIHEYGLGDTVSGYPLVMREGGPGPSIRFYSNITDGPDEVGDYVTFFMPLMTDVNVTQAAVVHISEAVSGFTWDFYVDIQQDFILNSTTWGYAVEGNQFLINVTFQNASNVIYIHDGNAAMRPGFDDTLTSHKSRFAVYNVDNVTNAHYVHFRPYHAIQVTSGAWTNTHIDPVYMLDGRVVNITDYVMINRTHYFAMVLEVAWKIGVKTFITLYTILDKAVLDDLLPNLNVTTQQFEYDGRANRGLRLGAGLLLFGLAMYTMDVYDWFVEYGPLIWAFITKGVALFIGVPFFIACVLVINSVKRFFVVWAADGPEVGMQYAAHLVRNAFKRLPLPDIDRSTWVERVSIKKERQKHQAWQRRKRGMYYARRHAQSRNYTRLGPGGEESQADLEQEYKWEQRRRLIRKQKGGY